MIVRRDLTIAFLFSLLFRSFFAPCALADGPHLGGHLKSLSLYLDAPPAAGTESGPISSNSLRLDLTLPVTSAVTFEFAMEGKALYADPAVGVSLPGDLANRRLDLEKNWHEDDWFSQQVSVDRLSLSGTYSNFDWTLGRQAIGFGRISLFSPLDVIAPFPPDALDTEVRPGVDALRLSRYFGLAGQVGTAVVLGEHREKNSYLLYGETNLSGIDLLGLAGQLRSRPMLGAGFATQILGMGLKGEAAFYRGYRVDRLGGDLHETFAVAASEVDYRFDNGLILFVQYLYNGAGVDNPRDYPRALASAPVSEGLSFLLGRHYLLSSVSYELHPLVELTGLVIRNLDDDSCLLRPMLSISLADDLSLDLFWTVNEGDEPKKINGSVVPTSEFGSVGNSIGLFLKIFF